MTFIEDKLAAVRLPSRYTRNDRCYSVDGSHFKAHKWLTMAKYIIPSVLASHLPTNVYKNAKLYTESVIRLYSIGIISFTSIYFITGVANADLPNIQCDLDGFYKTFQ